MAMSAATAFAQAPAKESWSQRCNAAGALPIIDAHSQFDHEIRDDLVLTRMGEHGVIGTILATRGKRSPTDAAALAQRHPHAIIAAASTKQRNYDPLPLWASGRFFSVAEILLFHARKGNRAPEVRIAPDAAALQPLYQKVADAKRPLILHIEFRSLEPEARPQYESALKSVLTTYASTPIGLIHMGQLGVREATQWLSEHPNLFLITSHADPLAARSRQPWINMFSGEELRREWKTLIEQRPDRFVFAMDNVWSEHWLSEYAERIGLWRKALGSLPEPVARQVACANAVRLWQLP